MFKQQCSNNKQFEISSVYTAQNLKYDVSKCSSSVQTTLKCSHNTEFEGKKKYRTRKHYLYAYADWLCHALVGLAHLLLMVLRLFISVMSCSAARLLSYV